MRAAGGSREPRGGSWSAGTGSGASSCTTDASGQCSIAWSGVRKKESSISYTVTGVGPLAHDAGDDHAASGNTVVIAKP